MLCALFGIWCAATVPAYTSSVSISPEDINQPVNCCASSGGLNTCWEEVGRVCHFNPSERVQPPDKPR